MSNLLSANFKRLWKKRVFWICAMAMFVISILYVLNGGRLAIVLEQDGYSRTLDDFYFSLVPYIGLLFAVFDSLFLGTEYSDGTIRNKIVVGHTRSTIFLSNYIVCFVANLILLLTWIAGGLVGIPFLGLWRIGTVEMAIYFFVAIFFTAALTAIMTLICMLSANKSITVVSAILFVLGILLIASMIYNSLCQAEFNSGIVITTQGLPQQGKLARNPNYVRGFMRTVYQLILDFLPTGQQIQMATVEIGNPIVSLLSSVVITVATTMAGIFAFNKKDLK